MENNFSLFLTAVWQTLKNWWWLPLPFILWGPFLFQYRFWKINEWLKKQKSVSLEIILPKEVLKPIRAMESVISGIGAVIYKPPDWWETWVDGEVQLSAHLELVSIDGNPHFYIRIPAGARQAVETTIYAQFPEAEVKIVEDYTKTVPQNIPNKDWDLFGSDYKLLRDDPYPIKTYPEFETEHETKEEKRIDPIAALMEAFARMEPGEQFWVQISIEPLGDDPPNSTNLSDFVNKAKKLRDKLAMRPEKVVKTKPIIQGVAEILLQGKTEEKMKEKEMFPPEMRLTPGERDVVAAIENKISKPLYKTNMRFIYLGPKKIWVKGNFRYIFTFFNQFMTVNRNGLIPVGKTITKIHKSWFLPLNLLQKRRQYLRCRKLFKNYVRRNSPYFPRPGGTFVLNTEEIASLFHFPGKTVVPTPSVSRVEAKKGGTSSLDLPTEE